MPRIEVFVPGLPRAQPRQRYTKQGRNYTPSTHPVQSFKEAVKEAVLKHNPGISFYAAPVLVEMTFWFKRPKSKVWRTRPMPGYRHTGKPDFDNLAKAVTDALSGIIWNDDAQICDAHIRKFVCSATDFPGVLLVIRTLEEEGSVSQSHIYQEERR